MAGCGEPPEIDGLPSSRLLHFTDVIRNLGVHIQTLHYAYETTDPGLYTTSVFGQSLHETQTQDPLA